MKEPVDLVVIGGGSAGLVAPGGRDARRAHRTRRAPGRLRDLAPVVHPYPGWSDGPWRAALDEVTAMTRRPATLVALGVVRDVRRRLTRHP